MLYHIDFHVEYSANMTQKDLFTIWSEEADTALSAKAAGVVIDLWKCVGTRRVIAIVNVETLDDLDRILLDLPIMKLMGQHVQYLRECPQATSLSLGRDSALILRPRWV